MVRRNLVAEYKRRLTSGCVGFSTFLPTIIQGLGTWTPEQVQLLTVPCYFLGVVTYMSVAYLSDRLQMRAIMCIIFGLVSVAGYAVLLSPASAGAHYTRSVLSMWPSVACRNSSLPSCFLVAMGLYVIVGLPIAWVRPGSPLIQSCTSDSLNETLTELSSQQIRPDTERELQQPESR